jgi:hydrogenase/urease accessory protein HupE
MKRRKARACLALAWLAFLPAVRAMAHGFPPSLLELRETDPGRFAVLWRTPADPPGEVAESAPARPILPSRCKATRRPATSMSHGTKLEEWAIDCGPEGLAGERLAISAGPGPRNEVLVRVAWRDRAPFLGSLRGGSDALVIAARASTARRLGAELALGIRHVLTGRDHLLFVLGLVLLVRSRRALVETITSFTVAHSVTLSLPALGIVALPRRPIEVLLALSIGYLALVIARDGTSPSAPSRRLRLVAFVFGLLHGFGFASGLASVGLPRGEIPLTLFGFNLGVEIGQLAFISALLLARGFVRLAYQEQHLAFGRRALAYVMGGFSCFWCLERLLWLAPS